MTEYDKKLKKFLIPVLRRATFRWKDRNLAFAAARIERGIYQCNSCKQCFGNKDIVVDHIEPVVPVDVGFTDWRDYIIRLFPEQNGFQVLCNICHDTKTSIEDNIRTANRQERKAIEKEVKKKLAKKSVKSTT